MNASFLGEEQCENVKTIVSKYGVTVVCNEEDEKMKERKHADVILPAGEQCEKMKTVASKIGMTVVCDEN